MLLKVFVVDASLVVIVVVAAAAAAAAVTLTYLATSLSVSLEAGPAASGRRSPPAAAESCLL